MKTNLQKPMECHFEICEQCKSTNLRHAIICLCPKCNPNRKYMKTKEQLIEIHQKIQVVINQMKTNLQKNREIGWVGSVDEAIRDNLIWYKENGNDHGDLVIAEEAIITRILDLLKRVMPEIKGDKNCEHCDGLRDCISRLKSNLEAEGFKM